MSVEGRRIRYYHMEYAYHISTSYAGPTERSLEVRFESQYRLDEEDIAIEATNQVLKRVLDEWEYIHLFYQAETLHDANPKGGRYRTFDNWYVEWGYERIRQLHVVRKPIMKIMGIGRRVNHIRILLFDHDYGVIRRSIPSVEGFVEIKVSERISPVPAPLRWYHIDFDSVVDYLMGRISLEELYEVYPF